METATHITAAYLQQLEILHEVPLEQLQWLVDHSECFWLEKGERLFSIGEPITATRIFLEGRMRFCVMQHGALREIAVFDTPYITGYLPYSRAVTTAVTAECLQRSLVMACPAEEINKIISQFYELTAVMVHSMTTRVRDFTAMQQQTEKMVALGKLSAGLAHELNNPAAAIARTSSMLAEQVEQLTALFKPLTQLQLSNEQVEVLDKKINKLLCAGPQPVKSMLQHAADEDELYDWMQELDVDAGELSANFADAGICVMDLEEIKKHASPQHLPLLLEWINKGTVAMKMAADIQESSNRISALVGSIKNYTQMDRDGNQQPTDIHTGIRNTLTILEYKLRKGNITVEEQFDLSIPPIVAFPGELNQVWTNVIDNAIDAMADKKDGKLTITTQQDKDFVEVIINDNGPGIPADIQSSVFDPFFTTKEVGKGTGMGLDIVHRVMRLHRGTVRLTSEPGNTSFRLCFPVKHD